MRGLVEIVGVDTNGAHPGQQEVLDSDARFQVLCAGRRWGKTKVSAAKLVGASIRVPAPYWWVSPTAKLAAIGWRELRHMTRPIPGVDVRLGDRTIYLPGGGHIAVRTAGEPGGLRGDGLGGLVYDEAAMGREESWTEELRPALSDLKGWALFPSTPKGRNNWFHRLYLRGNGDDPDWQSWRFPTRNNPFIDSGEIDAARELLPTAVFDQEYGAEFNDAGASPFKQEDIDAMRVGWRGMQPRKPGGRYVTAWDIGRRGDPTVGITADVSSVPYQVVAFDREHRMPFPAQQTMIEDRAAEYGDMPIIEENGSIAMIENMNIRVQPFQTTARSKVEALQALVALMERGAIKADIPDLTRELESYQWDDGGLVQDCVMTLAILARHLPPVTRIELSMSDSDDFRPSEYRPATAGARSEAW